MLIIVGGLCFIVPSVIWGLYLLAFRMRSAQAVGTIVDYHGDREVTAPVVEFQLPDGTKVTFTEPTHTNETFIDVISDLLNTFVLKKDINQVNVLYDPNNPQKARVNRFKYLYFFPFLLFIIGSCIILYAIPFFRDILAPIFNFLDLLSKNL